MIHELRIYKCMPGRLPDLNKRFETVTLKLWEKHGFRPVAFWTVRIGPSNQDLYYLLGEGRTDRREHREHDPLADRLLEAQVGSPLFGLRRNFSPVERLL